jgi:hypothetical protein
MTTENEFLPVEDCLDYNPDECQGTVEYRIAMSGTGISYPRCLWHFDVRWETQQRLARDYGVPVYYTGNDRDYEDYDY